MDSEYKVTFTSYYRDALIEERTYPDGSRKCVATLAGRYIGTYDANAHAKTGITYHLKQRAAP